MKALSHTVMIIGLILAALAIYLVLNAQQDFPKGCTMEAKLCPDGSAVGRTGPDCEFAPCPSGEVYCSSPRPEVCTEEYMPVCGWFGPDVQCIRYPCASTFGNGCLACSDINVAYYTPGECPS